MIARAKREAKRKIRYAVVGLGYFAQKRALPAFAHAKENSELAALVSDDPRKLSELGRRYRVEDRYSYADYDQCLRSGIDAVYLALPNSLHAEYAIRAAEAGVHVLTEKPMATTVRDCEDMIDAARRAKVKLMVAYRLHYEKANLEALRQVREGRIGEPRFFTSSFSMQVAEGNIRTRQEMGGGALGDLGVYCINAARTLFHSEPTSAFAVSTHHGERFRDVDEMTSAVLAFPKERTAVFTCSFGAADTASYRIVGTDGSIQLDQAYEESGSISMTVCVKGRSTTRAFPTGDQVAPEFIEFSRCILDDREPEPSGEEGLADVEVIEGLQFSARNGTAVRFGTGERTHAQVDPDHAMRRPSVREVELVHAEEPAR